MYAWYAAERIYVKAHIQRPCYDAPMTRKKSGYDKEQFFRALADRTRLRLLNLMRGDDPEGAAAGGIVAHAEAVEQLLGVVEPRAREVGNGRERRGASRRRFGRHAAEQRALAVGVDPPDEEATKVLKETMTWLAADAEMQRDRDRLVKVCCATNLPVSIQGAPRPASVRTSA